MELCMYTQVTNNWRVIYNIVVTNHCYLMQTAIVYFFVPCSIYNYVEMKYYICWAFRQVNGSTILSLRFHSDIRYVLRADSRFAPSQWETTLLCNDVYHWLGASLLFVYALKPWRNWTLCCRQPFEMHFAKGNFCILIQISLLKFCRKT